jgi:hypothetical protein
MEKTSRQMLRNTIDPPLLTLDWPETLLVLQAGIGEPVEVGVGPLDDSIPALSHIGVIRCADHYGEPDDFEGFMFYLDDGSTTLNIESSRFERTEVRFRPSMFGRAPRFKVEMIFDTYAVAITTNP